MSKCFMVLADGQVICENDVFRCEGEEFISVRNKSELYAFPIFGEPEVRGINELCANHIEMIGNIETSIEKESKIMNTITNIKEFSKELNNYGYKVKMQSHVKNGKDMMALQVFKPGADNRLCPIIYVSNFEVDEFDAKTMARSVLAQVKDESERVLSYLDILNDWDLMQPLLRICVRPKTENMSDVRRDFLDLELYVRAVLPGNETDEGTRSVVITHDLCKRLGVTEDEIFSRAFFNVHESMKQMDFSSVLPFASPDSGMNILSSGEKTHGAGVMALLPLLLSESGYILPSSIHELIYVPEERTDENTSGFRQIVREVNETAVDEQDFLSDSVYYYDADKKILILA